MSAFEKGYVHLTSDQQPFLQGYLPVLSLCQTAVLGTGAIMQDTGAPVSCIIAPVPSTAV